MKIGFTKDVEKKRVNERAERPTSWEILKTRSMVEALHTAKDMGWKDKKVQVRYEEDEEGEVFYVEPFEKDCGCKGMLKYKAYFD